MFSTNSGVSGYSTKLSNGPGSYRRTISGLGADCSCCFSSTDVGFGPDDISSTEVWAGGSNHCRIRSRSTHPTEATTATAKAVPIVAREGFVAARYDDSSTAGTAMINVAISEIYLYHRATYIQHRQQTTTSDGVRQMRPGDIDDKFWDEIKEEFKRRRGIVADMDNNNIVFDILTEWKNTKKVRS